MVVRLALLRKPGCSRVNEMKKFSKLGRLEEEGEETHGEKNYKDNLFLTDFVIPD